MATWATSSRGSVMGPQIIGSPPPPPPRAGSQRQPGQDSLLGVAEAGAAIGGERRGVVVAGPDTRKGDVAGAEEFHRLAEQQRRQPPAARLGTHIELGHLPLQPRPRVEQHAPAHPQRLPRPVAGDEEAVPPPQPAPQPRPAGGAPPPPPPPLPTPV